MSQKLLGVAVRGNKANEVLDMIERAEQLGIHAAWMTTGGARLDSITLATSPSPPCRLVPSGRAEPCHR